MGKTSQHPVEGKRALEYIVDGFLRKRVIKKYRFAFEI